MVCLNLISSLNELNLCQFLFLLLARGGILLETDGTACNSEMLQDSNFCITNLATGFLNL